MVPKAGLAALQMIRILWESIPFRIVTALLLACASVRSAVSHSYLVLGFAGAGYCLLLIGLALAAIYLRRRMSNETVS